MEETLYYNAIAVAAAGDRRKTRKLKKKFGTWERAYRALRNLHASIGDAEAEWKKLVPRNMALAFPENDCYPALLREVADRPLGIYIRGTLPPSDAPTVAVVGTRRATPDGKNIARQFARDLAQAGCAIVSGLAFGIDAAAHEGCLMGRGKTVAVLAGGLDRVYPREHERLAEKILGNGGAIISEYPPGIPAYADRFLERNRVISGLTRGVLIVEAPMGSGSLATARCALEQNRDVFVVPGPITHPNFAGSHALIRQGATLVTSAEEILEALGVTRGEKIEAMKKDASDEEALILEGLGSFRKPIDVDKIAAITKLEPQIVNRTLSFLLLRNAVKEEGGGYTI